MQCLDNEIPSHSATVHLIAVLLQHHHYNVSKGFDKNIGQSRFKYSYSYDCKNSNIKN